MFNYEFRDFNCPLQFLLYEKFWESITFALKRVRHSEIFDIPNDRETEKRREGNNGEIGENEALIKRETRPHSFRQVSFELVINLDIETRGGEEIRGAVKVDDAAVGFLLSV